MQDSTMKFEVETDHDLPQVQHKRQRHHSGTTVPECCVHAAKAQNPGAKVKLVLDLIHCQVCGAVM